MPDITITINTPILTGSDYFKTRYRLVGGAYSANVNRTNAPFTLSGLIAGQYELEVIVVKDGIECTATVHPFEIIGDYSCVTFTPVIVQNGELYNLQISYGAHVTPPCGWHIEIIGTQNNKIVNYASLPASPLLIPVVNEGFQLRVIADLCNGKSKTCLNTDVPPIIPTCTPMVITSTTIILDQSYTNYMGFIITFFYTQSTPPTQAVTLIVNQLNVLNNGVPGGISFPNFSLPIPAGNGSIGVPILANADVFASIYDFEWLIVDSCGASHTGTLQIQL